MDTEKSVPDLKDLDQEFFKIIITLLEHEGFSNIKNPKPLEKETADLHLLAINSDKRDYAIAIRTYRSPSIPTMSATFAIRNLRTLINRSSSKNGLLILTAHLPELYRKHIDFDNSLYKIWDLTVLEEKFSKYPELYSQFQSLIKELQPFKEAVSGNKEIVSANVVSEQIQKDLDKVSKENFERIVASIKSEQGNDIADKLRGIVSGSEDATKFEDVMIEALRFLFKEDLTAFKPQKKTDALHRFDLIARIASSDEFWLTLENHFRTKYVVFEFKNYSERITQKEIYSTEKYLYLPAMRSVAIIISTHGPNENAQSAARGALRENGKVILNLTVKDIIAMLTSKDEGANPNDTMTTILDDMLMKIER